jgi:hypothetical protein
MDKGRWIKTDLVRPIQILAPPIVRKYGLTPSPGQIYIANLNHMDQFYIAGIPADSVSNVFYQIQKFYKPIPAIAHGQIRLTFREPVVLIPQVNGDGSAIQTSDLVFSIHAVGADHDYDPIGKGTDGSYSLVLGIFSTETKIAESARRGFSIEQWKLNLSADQMKEYVLNYLDQSQSWGYFKEYHTRDRNCGSEMIKVLDTAIGYQRKSGQEIPLSDVLGERYPFLVVPVLRKRGLVGSARDSRYYDLENEPDAWIQSLYRSYRKDRSPDAGDLPLIPGS